MSKSDAGFVFFKRNLEERKILIYRETVTKARSPRIP